LFVFLAAFENYWEFFTFEPPKVQTFLPEKMLLKKIKELPLSQNVMTNTKKIKKLKNILF